MRVLSLGCCFGGILLVVEVDCDDLCMDKHKRERGWRA